MGLFFSPPRFLGWEFLIAPFPDHCLLVHFDIFPVSAFSGFSLRFSRSAHLSFYWEHLKITIAIQHGRHSNTKCNKSTNECRFSPPWQCPIMLGIITLAEQYLHYLDLMPLGNCNRLGELS